MTKPAWVSAPQNFLFPVHVLGALFRGKFLCGLKNLGQRGLIQDPLAGRAARRRRSRLYKQSWIVFAKRPFGGSQQVFAYLGRYTHRVAISNARIISVENDTVVFRTRGDQTAQLPSVDFARRFLDHVLPSRFVKIRHFGLHASGNVNGRLERARTLLAPDSSPTQTPTSEPKTPVDDQNDGGPDPQLACEKRADLPWSQLLWALTNIDLEICPACHKRAVIRVPLPQAPRPPPHTTGIS